MAKCRGSFSTDGFNPETKQRLRDELGSGTIPTGRCNVCGKGPLVAKNYGGEWVPESHDRPQRYNSGKGTGRKR